MDERESKTSGSSEVNIFYKDEHSFLWKGRRRRDIAIYFFSLF